MPAWPIRPPPRTLLFTLVVLFLTPSHLFADTLWIDDAVPVGAKLCGSSEGWTWSAANPPPFSGGAAHSSVLLPAMHQHCFDGASIRLQVESGAVLFSHVYLDPSYPPREVMLQWHDGTWEHRAYWGENLIPWGAEGTASRRYMGPRPPLGQWVRLDVPAALVGLEGREIHGMAFTLYGGKASWDASGMKTRSGWVDDRLPAGVTPFGTWQWSSFSPTPFSGTSAHAHGPASGLAQHGYYAAPQTRSVAVGATLYSHVFLDPQNPPREIMLQWIADGSWEHRAFWGQDLIAWGAPGSASRRSMGSLPPTGRWVRLEVPASLVGLEGRSLSGIAFTAYDGLVFWDSAGVRNPSDPPFPVPFSTAAAAAQVVSYAPALNVAGVTDGLDASGRRVWASGAYGTHGYRHGAPGRVVEMVDEYGNRLIRQYSPSGALEETLHRFNYGGTWYERSTYDANGAPILEETSSGASRLDERLRQLGITPGVPPAGPSYQESESGGWRTTTLQNSFALSVEQVHDPATLPLGQVYHREITLVGGLRTEVTLRNFGDRIRVADDWGAWRDEWFDAAGRLVAANDLSGTIFVIEYDAAGRTSRIYFGEVGLLEYSYDAEGWVTKKFIDRPSGEVIYQDVAQIRAGEFFQRLQEVRSQPRQVTRAHLPEHGMVAEWDEVFRPNGAAVATLFSMPYAFVPLDHSEPIWRSVTPGLGGFCQERIDYTDDEIMLHLERDSGGPDSTNHTTAFRFPRLTAASAGAAAAAAPSVGSNPRSTKGEPASEIGELKSIFEAGDGGVFCSGPNYGCICITRRTSGGDSLTIRCPAPPVVTSPGAPPVPAKERPRDRNQLPGMRLSGPLKVHVGQGMKLALEKLDGSESCRKLFADLGEEGGASIIRTTEYRNGDGATNATGEVPCNADVSAWTNVRSRVVLVCSRFSNLGAADRATKIIHEALHTAGQKESPGYPGYPTRGQLDQRVREACGL